MSVHFLNRKALVVSDVGSVIFRQLNIINLFSLLVSTMSVHFNDEANLLKRRTTKVADLKRLMETGLRSTEAGDLSDFKVA